MIYDHIKNIGLYKGLTPAIDLALDYIATVTPDVEVGSHPLDLGVKAVVSEYTTSLVNAKGYEAHRRYIDVQLALKGTEAASAGRGDHPVRRGEGRGAVCRLPGYRHGHRRRLLSPGLPGGCPRARPGSRRRLRPGEEGGDEGAGPGITDWVKCPD